jgi:serine/threonine protein kinase
LISDLLEGDPRDIGPYRLLGRIGAGGMGVVYLASSPDDEVVAIKLIRTDLAADPGFRLRFRREVAAARRVGGTYTAQVRDADVEANQPWVVTDYVAGPNLADLVARHGPLDAAQQQALAAGLAEALSAVHTAGVVHRDIKPTNVLCSPSGPRLIDFGIAQAGDVTSATLTGQVLGSPAWMAPEQIRGQPAAPTVDLFALGSVLVFAATGHPPFGEGQLEAVMYRILNEPPQLGSGQIAGNLHPLVVRLLDKNPSRRPSPSEVLASIVRPSADPTIGVTQLIDRTWVLPASERPDNRPIATARSDREPRGLRRLVVTVAAVVVAALAATAIAYAVVRPSHKPTPPHQLAANGAVTTPPSSTTSAATAASATTVAAASATTTTPTTTPATGPADIPVVECPTTYGFPGEGNGQALPLTIALNAAPGVAAQLEYYSNNTRTVTPVLGPKGWDCRAGIGADGSAGISIYPPGQAPNSASSPTPGVPLISASSAGGCQSCVYEDVCTLAPTAATSEYGDYANGFTCPALPPDETVYWINGTPNSTTTENPDVISYADPSSPDPTNGVVLYTYTSNPGGGDGSASTDTCTLPANEHDLCTVILNDFITSDWRMN